jgi:hypothetical protein
MNGLKIIEVDCNMNALEDSAKLTKDIYTIKFI